MARPATALALYVADPGRTDAVRAWQAELDTEAARFPGFSESRLTVPDRGAGDWATSVTFTSERRLRTWLGSPERAALTRRAEAAGVSHVAPAIVLLEGEAPPAGISVFTHRVIPGREDPFRRVEADLNIAVRDFPGYLASVLLEPKDPAGIWMSVVRFDTDAHLAAWIGSPRRAELLPQLQAQLQEEFGAYTRSTPFGSIVRVGSGGTIATPMWKTGMIVLLVLYPVVMLLSRFAGPFLADAGADPGLALWISQVVSTIFLTYLCMPLATRAFRWWLDPLDGADTRTSIKGAVIVILGYAVTLVVFLAIKDLQWWDYQS